MSVSRLSRFGASLARRDQKPKTALKGPWSIWPGTVMATGLALLLVAPPAKAQAPPVRHGADLNAMMTGPAAIGLTPVKRFAAPTLRDGARQPFMREIANSATYDGFEVKGPHLLIENIVLTGGLDIFTKKPLVMRGVIVETEAFSHWAVFTRPKAGPFYFLWSEARARSTRGAPADRSLWLARALYLTSDNATVYRSHMHHAADGIQIHGVGTRIIENVIDNLVYWKDDHNDGIQMLGRGSGAEILRNRIENPNPLVSAINANGRPIHIEANYLAGGGYTLYGGSRNNGHGTLAAQGVVVIDNIFGRKYFPAGGKWGALTYWETTPGRGNEWRANRFDDGTAIVAPGNQR